jgi:HAD superfamily hydrolase (TIGR01458 family)
VAAPVSAVVLDLQGTVYADDALLPGAADGVAGLRAAGHAVRFVTNTDSAASDPLLARLRAMGLDIERAELFTPIDAAAALFAGRPGARTLVLAPDAVRDQLAESVDVVGPDDDPTDVVVGDTRDTLSYGTLDAAFRAVLAGARLVALQRGRWFLSGGRPTIDTGAVVVALEYAAEVEALTVGKPSVDFLRLAVGTVTPTPAARDTWVVGDDRSSDVTMGLAAGVHTVLVRTGKYARQADDDALPRPEHTIDDLSALPALIAAG